MSCDVCSDIYVCIFIQGDFVLKIEPPVGWSFGKTDSCILTVHERVIIMPAATMKVMLHVFCMGVFSPEPTSVDLYVDGVSDICTKEEDINFVFTGFSVSGTVRSALFTCGIVHP